ncbi:MAG: hypothetical protein WBB67_04780, partial [bacterium]
YQRQVLLNSISRNKGFYSIGYLSSLIKYSLTGLILKKIKKSRFNLGEILFCHRRNLFIITACSVNCKMYGIIDTAGVVSSFQPVLSGAEGA